MIIGVPKEIKRDEYRVALLPVGVEELTRPAIGCWSRPAPGWAPAWPTRSIRPRGRKWSPARGRSSRADMILKVKEPQPQEWPLLRRGRRVHLLPLRRRPRADRGPAGVGRTCVAYETLRDAQGRLPLLTPMSEVAGRMSIQEGAKYLERPQMGRGILLGGVPGVAPAHIAILGGGVVGANAAKIAAGFRADVGVLDINMDRLRYLDDIMPPNVNVLFSDRHTIREQLQRADLVIGAC